MKTSREQRAGLARAAEIHRGREAMTVVPAHLVALCSDLDAAIERAERADNRANEYHRRAQAAEAAVTVTVDDCRRQGVSLGRSLANAGYRALTERAERAEGALREIDAQFTDCAVPGCEEIAEILARAKGGSDHENE